MATKNVWEYDEFVLILPVQLHSTLKRSETGDGFLWLPDGMPLSKHVTAETREFVHQCMKKDKESGRQCVLLLPVKFKNKHPWFQKDHVWYPKIEVLEPVR